MERCLLLERWCVHLLQNVPITQRFVLVVAKPYEHKAPLTWFAPWIDAVSADPAFAADILSVTLRLLPIIFRVRYQKYKRTGTYFRPKMAIGGLSALRIRYLRFNSAHAGEIFGFSV